MLSILPCRHRVNLRSQSQTLWTLLLIGGLAVGSCLSSSAGSLEFGVLSGLVSQGKSESSPSVRSQTNTLYQMARKEIRAGNIEKGKSLLQQVLALDPMHKKAKQELEKLAKQEASIAPAAKAAEVPPVENLTAKEMIDVAISSMRDGDYENAQVILDKALKKSSNDKEKKQIQALLDTIEKDRKRADQVKQSVMDYNLSTLDSHLQKASIYMENNQFDQAEAELQKAKVIAPDDKRVDQFLNHINNLRNNAQKAQAKQEQAAQAAQGREIQMTADSLFNEGVVLYKQGQIIQAVEKWNQALEIAPDHQKSQTFLNNTRVEYEQAVAARTAAEQKATEEAGFEAKLDTPIVQYSTAGENLDIKDVLSTLSKLSGLNMVMGENLEGKVSFDVKDTTIRNVLNLIQKQYGFIWHREKDTIFVERGFKTRIFPLSEAQFKTIDAILTDPSVLEDSSKNLKAILYGPSEEFNVPGKQLFLNRATRSLVVTDTQDNLRVVEAFLKEMPPIVGTAQRPVETRTYRLDRDISREVYEIIKLVLFKGQGAYDITDLRRQLYLEPNSNVLIVIDYPENIQEVEKILANQQITQGLEAGDLVAKQFQLTDIDDVEDTPEAFQRREELVTEITNVIQQMLYGREGVDAARLQGRMIVPNPARGSVDVVDTRENIRRVDEYLNTVKGEAAQDIIIETFPILHVDVFTIADALAYLFFDSQQSTRSNYLSQNAFQSIGSNEQGDTGADAGNLFEETTRNRFQLSGGGGGGTDLLQFLALRFYPDVSTNSIVVFTPDQDTIALVNRVITTFDKPQRMIELEIRTVSASLTDLRSINFDYMLTDPFVDKISLNPEMMQTDVNMSTEQSPGLNLGIHTFGRSRMDFLMSLLESTKSFNVLSSPKVLTIANPIDPPLVFVGQQIPYAESANYDDQGDDDPTNNRIIYNYNRTFVGNMLPVIPFILNDDHIYLELAPQIIEPGERLPVEVTGNVAPGAQTANVGPLLLNQQYLRSSIRMKNGTTVVLGGLITERENETQDKVPILSKIPLLGNLFIDRNIEKQKASILFFITARIIEPSL